MTTAEIEKRLYSHPLTPREVQVLRHIAHGDSDRVIGRELGITPQTAHNHVRHIRDKLGVQDRTTAVMYALRLKIISLWSD